MSESEDSWRTGDRSASVEDAAANEYSSSKITSTSVSLTTAETSVSYKNALQRQIVGRRKRLTENDDVEVCLPIEWLFYQNASKNCP